MRASSVAPTARRPGGGAGCAVPVNLLGHPSVAEIVRNADVAHVAVHGQHVTPELYCSSSGRIWFATARRTLKARKLKKHDSVGLLFRWGQKSVLVSGTALPLDILEPRTLLDGARHLPAVPAAAAGFVARNGRHLIGLAVGSPRALPHSPATARVIVAVEPVCAAVIGDHGLEDVFGPWAGRGAPAASWPKSLEANAVLGWKTAHGPLPLPSAWDPVAAEAAVPAALMKLVGADLESRASVVFSEMEGTGITGKQGVTLRGEAASRRNARTWRLSIEADTATHWIGVHTHSLPLGG